MTTPVIDPESENFADDIHEHQWLIAGALATLLTVLLSVMVYLIAAPLVMIAGVGAALATNGLYFGHRGHVGMGTGILGVASLAATSGLSLGANLGVNAITAVVLVAVLLVADLSFALRRATVASTRTVQGMLAVHALAAIFGVVVAVTTLSLILAVSWPPWLLVVPAVLLGAAAIVLAFTAHRFNRKVRPKPVRPAATYLPPPPPVGIRTTVPPPPAAGARPTRQLPPPPPGPHERPLRR